MKSRIDQARRDDAERAAMDYVMKYEKENGREPEDVSALNIGWDITSTEPKTGKVRYIEVKGHSGRSNTNVSENEWNKAKELSEDYYLYVVFHASNERRRDLHIKQDPAHKADPERRLCYIIKPNDVEGG